MPRRSLLVSLACATLLAGCVVPRPIVPLGHDFPKLAFASFVLEQTSLSEVQADLGAPMRQSTMSGIAKPGAHGIVPGTHFALVKLEYWYAPFGLGKPAILHPAKVASLVFFNNQLMAYDYTTSMPGEVAPPITDDQLAQLHYGQTTLPEAIALLGTPAGELRHKFDAQQGNSQINYGWKKVTNGMVDQRSVQVFFDRTGRLINYTALNNSYPVNNPPPPVQVAPQVPQAPGSPIPPADLSHT